MANILPHGVADSAKAPPLWERIAIVLLLILGAAFWLALKAPSRGIGPIRWEIVIGAGVIACIAQVSQGLNRAMRFLSRECKSPKALRINALCVWLLSAGYFVLTAVNQDRDLFPKTYDDCSYAIGMQILARGRLWMPPLPLPDFFDSFYILVHPVYCSLYFPGTALLYTPTVWLHLPFWLMPAIASGAAVALIYLIFTEMMDPITGWLAAIMLISLSWFRVYTVLLTGHVPMLLLGLLLIWAWLQWRKSRQIRWAIIMGASAGWAAITRPADAIVYAIPIAIAILMELRAMPRKRWLLEIACMFAAALPFLTLQLIFDRGVTGRLFRAPYGYYLSKDQPGSEYGFHAFNPAAVPESTLPEKREFQEKWARPFIAEHTPGNVARLWGTRWLPEIVDTTLPCRLLLLFLPIGLLGLTDIRRRALAATLPLFVLVYLFNPFFLEHYAIAVIPAILLFVLLGGRKLSAAWPRFGSRIDAAFVMIVLASSLTGLWEINHLITTPATRISDETFPSIYLRIANRDLSQYVEAPAVVLFAYHPGGNFFEEPVYNTDVAWPNDAPIIRAHDLGEIRNREIFAYYARTQPDRVFWSFDPARTGEPLKKLGLAATLARTSAKEH